MAAARILDTRIRTAILSVHRLGFAPRDFAICALPQSADSSLSPAARYALVFRRLCANPVWNGRVLHARYRVIPTPSWNHRSWRVRNAVNSVSCDFLYLISGVPNVRAPNLWTGVID